MNFLKRVFEKKVVVKPKSSSYTFIKDLEWSFSVLDRYYNNACFCFYPLVNVNFSICFKCSKQQFYDTDISRLEYDNCCTRHIKSTES
jgi:hypothetical protein